MKKIFLILLLLFLTSFNKGYCGIAIQSTGGTTIGSNYVSTPPRSTISTVNYNCIVKNIGVLQPGTYTTKLQFDSAAGVDKATTPEVIVKSNGTWKLILDTTGIGTLKES